MLRRLPFAIFVILLLGLALGGCGDGGDEAGTTHPVVVSSSQPAARVSPTALPPPATQTPISSDAAPTSAETATQAAIAPTLATVSTGTTTTMAATGNRNRHSRERCNSNHGCRPFSPLCRVLHQRRRRSPPLPCYPHRSLPPALHLAPPAARAAIRLLSGWDCSWLPAAWRHRWAWPTPGTGADGSLFWKRWAASGSFGTGSWLARPCSTSTDRVGSSATSRVSWAWPSIPTMPTTGPFLSTIQTARETRSSPASRVGPDPDRADPASEMTRADAGPTSRQSQWRPPRLWPRRLPVHRHR